MPAVRKSQRLGKAAGASMPPLALRITSEDSLRQATQALYELDRECIGRMLEIAGPPPLRARKADLASLVWIIVSQQVSTASARAIYARVEARFAGMDHAEIHAAADCDLRACGLSAPKMRTIRNICDAVGSGALDIGTLTKMEIADARTCMTAIKGVGPWTADIFLLFCLGHPDVWPAGDLALQEGVKLALGLRKRPDRDRLEKISRRWQPYRAAAARLIWAYYGRMLQARKEAGRLSG